MAAIFLLSTEIKVGRLNEKQDISIFQDYDGTINSARNNYYSSWIWILSLKNSPFKISSKKTVNTVVTFARMLAAYQLFRSRD